MNKEKLLGQIDSTLLRPNITESELIKLCEDAKAFNFAAVCVHPIHIKLCKKLLKGNKFKVKIATVVSFPFGEESTKSKVRGVKEAFRAGADEVDFVISISSVKSNDWDNVAKEIQKIVSASRNRTLKAIIETAYLTDEEIKRVCEICVKANIRYVKTSTGYAPKGAEARVVKLMSEAIYEAGRIKGDEMHPCEIKASGGIKTMADLIEMSKAGAVRFGTSSAYDIAMTEVQANAISEPEEEEKEEEKEETADAEVKEAEVKEE